jgi:galactose-1-phosphate uridylyltransferase
VNQQLEREMLNSLLQAENIEDLSFTQIVEMVQKEVSDFLPDGVYQVDPRNGNRILYHSSRARRPHDNRPTPSEIPERACIICQGNTTGIIDVAELDTGFTFINKNLFPVLYPQDGTVRGLHFLQWTSSQHDKDWHNLPREDCTVVMKRLAALGKKLLEGDKKLFPPAHAETDRSQGFVVIIKNCGRLVGGSLAHGHQQIAYSSVMPRCFLDNRQFEQTHGETFSDYLQRENPPELLLKDYGPALLLIPYFMQRPYNMMLLVKDTSKQHLHQLDEVEIAAVAQGWHDALGAIHTLMPQLGRETAYNVITHNGPGAGLYFELLPYTQETGGLEHLGLFVCQELPQRAAARTRNLIQR